MLMDQDFPFEITANGTSVIAIGYRPPRKGDWYLAKGGKGTKNPYFYEPRKADSDQKRNSFIIKEPI